MNEENSQNPTQKGLITGLKKENSTWEFVKYIVLALAIVIPFRIFIAQPYVVSGASMDPTFKDADYLIVDQLSKRFEEPKRQSVVIIKYPNDTSKFFIKRLIAFPGETVEIKGGDVYIYNEQNEKGLKLSEPYIVFKKTENFSIKLNEDQYFVLGDNRAGSSDSRIWGTLPKKYIIGTPILRLLPINEVSIRPGKPQ
jgi:signal peptidase I